MGVWSPWAGDKVRQNPLGFIGSGPAVRRKAAFCTTPPPPPSPQGLEGSAHPRTAQNLLGRGGGAAASSPGPREAVVHLGSCSNSSRDTSPQGHI